VAGPGVPGSRSFGVTGLDTAVLAAIGEANQGYPAGVDTWLVAGDGTVIGLPRSSTLVLNGGD
jgi:alpha-D-ribose 1-methylphosphonate 5-triphosphate synthase subunit PhnH